MSGSYLLDYMYFMVFLVGGFLTAFGPFVVAILLRPRVARSKKMYATYECGMDTFGDAWDFRYGVHYYLYALIFLAFDVDILYLFPVATAYDMVSGVRGVFELLIFIGILSLAIVYAWVKGVFKWERKTKPALN